MNAGVLVLQTALLVALAPLWGGVVARLEARLQMRRGRPVLQRYRDLFKLPGKETVLSEHASPLARVAPYLMLGAALTLCTWTPVLTTRPGMGFAGDLVMTVALLAAMRVLLALLAMEAGTTFGGMSASRHLALSALAEPALMLAVFTLALNARSTDLAGIAAAVVAAPAAWLSPSHLLALTAVWIVVVSETGRGPVDNPDTHLELTMIHEGMALDVSGHHLALLEWAASVRQLVLLTLVANLFLPWGIAGSLEPRALGVALLAWLGKLAVFAVVVALTESLTAKMRLFRVPEFLGMAFLLALIALASDTLGRG
ncbi:MAG: NADH-quinone oxidoreductase subunit H [Candidatus Eisenbacteria bacterium]|nr:NADH-quinone oxidoreductase subunit H [Candidatus Eisenbacteria bacterium]